MAVFEKAVRVAAEMLDRNLRDLRFRDSAATCPKCKRRLTVAYCEERVYAVRCRQCETITIVKAACPNNAAEKVGIVAIPLVDWSEDDGDIVAARFPIRDAGDVCIGHPLSDPPDIPKDFTHFMPLPYAVSESRKTE